MKEFKDFLLEYFKEQNANTNLYENKIYFDEMFSDIYNTILQSRSTFESQEQFMSVAKWMVYSFMKCEDGIIEFVPNQKEDSFAKGYVFSHKYRYSIDEEGNFKRFTYSIYSTPRSDSYNQFDVCYKQQTDIINDDGVEILKTIEEPIVSEKKTYDEVYNGGLRSQLRYGFNCSTTKAEIKRCNSLGNAYVRINSSGLSSFGFYTKLYGEHIEKLYLPDESNRIILSILNFYTDQEAQKKYKFLADMTREIERPEIDESPEYYRWVASEIDLVRNSKTQLKMISSLVSELTKIINVSPADSREKYQKVYDEIVEKYGSYLYSDETPVRYR